MAGQRQKSPGLLADHRRGRGRTFEVVPQPQRIVPAAPETVGEYARGVWDAFFASWVASAVNYDAHGERLRHWIRCVDERERLWPLLVSAPLVKGSHGQLMVNPLMRRVRELTRDIERAEEAYGMTPLATWRMQLTATEAKRSANDLRWELMRPVEGPDDDVIDLEDL
jgi:hypothetical protein